MGGGAGRGVEGELCQNVLPRFLKGVYFKMSLSCD